MALIRLSIMLPNGQVKNIEVDDDVPMNALIPEIVTILQVPTLGPDGRPMHYELDSKALGRRLQSNETFQGAKVPENDRLVLGAEVTPGS